MWASTSSSPSLATMSLPAKEESGKKIDLAALLAPILTCHEVQKNLNPVLSPGVLIQQTVEEIEKLLACPEFQQAMDTLNAGQASEQLAPLLGQLGLSPEAVKGDLDAVMQYASKSRGKQLDLVTLLTPEVMAPILADPGVQERLKPHLPPGVSLPKTAEEIQKTLASPEFQKAMGTLSVGPDLGQKGAWTDQPGQSPKAGTAPQGSSKSGRKQLNLAALMPPEMMASILSKQEVQENLKLYLPPPLKVPKTSEEFEKAKESQAIIILSAIMPSLVLGPLTEPFGLPDEVVKAANEGDTAALVNALPNQIRRRRMKNIKRRNKKMR